MASPAATLAIMVEANTKAATVALTKLDSKLTGIDKTTATATTRTTALGKASKSAGTHLRSAAGYAASAAAAYLSISQARAAITTTQDLASASDLLARNLGFTTKQASRWASVGKTRDITTRQMNASFATLTSKLVDAKAGSEEALAAFRSLGITQQDLAKDGDNFQKQLFTVADALDEASGGAARQDAAVTLLGRGYQNLLPLMNSGSAALEKQLKLGDQYGATMGKDAVEAQMKLIASQRESERAWQGMQVTFTQMLTPALVKANDQFQDIARILASDALTSDEKFRKVAGIIGNWADKAFDAFVTVLPKIVSKAAEQGPKIAVALAKGFLDSDIWGKLLIGGWLISKLGGAAALTKVGTKAGKITGRGFGIGMAAGLVLFGPDLIKGAFDLGKKASDAVLNAFGANKDAQKAVKGWGDVVQESQKPFKDWMNPILLTTRHGWQDMNSLTKKGLRDGLRTTQDGLKKEEDQFRKTKDKTIEATRKQADGVIGNTNSMLHGVLTGFDKLGQNTGKVLKSFGAKWKGYSIEVPGMQGRQRGGPIGFATGGLASVVPGSGSGDKVTMALDGRPVAKVEPREGIFVGNRNLMAAMAQANAMVPRFATGGIIGLGKSLQSQGYLVGEHPAFGGVAPVHAPGSYHYSGQALDVNWMPVAQEPAKLDSLYGKLKNMPGVIELLWRVADHYDHLHVALAKGAGGALKGGMGNLAKILLKGPDGPLKDMGQGALDKARKAANAFLSKQTVEGSEPALTGSGDVEKTFAAVAKKLSTSKTATLALGMAGYAESGMRDLPGGDASSQGALQLLASTAAGLGVSPHDEKAVASLFLQRGFYGRGGANALAASGLPAHLVAQNVQGSAFSSGSNYLAQLGPAKAWMARFGLMKGGYAGSFAQGGVVPGPVGQPVAATVHGGETIVPSGDTFVRVFIGERELTDIVGVEIDGKFRQVAKKARSRGPVAGRKVG